MEQEKLTNQITKNFTEDEIASMKECFEYNLNESNHGLHQQQFIFSIARKLNFTEYINGLITHISGAENLNDAIKYATGDYLSSIFIDMIHAFYWNDIKLFDDPYDFNDDSMWLHDKLKLTDGCMTCAYWQIFCDERTTQGKQEALFHNRFEHDYIYPILFAQFQKVLKIKQSKVGFSVIDELFNLIIRDLTERNENK